MSIERRGSPRYKLIAPVTYRGVNIDGSGTVANISASGALIEPASPSVRPGISLGVRISCFPGSFGVELPSEVVRATDSGFAVCFKELKPEGRSVLDSALSSASYAS